MSQLSKLISKWMEQMSRGRKNVPMKQVDKHQPNVSTTNLPPPPPPPPNPPVITTTSLNSMTQGTPFSQQLMNSGGVGTLVWSLSIGSVGGMTLSNSGLFSGTPTGSGAYNIIARLADSNGDVDTQVLSGTIASSGAKVYLPGVVNAGLTDVDDLEETLTAKNYPALSGWKIIGTDTLPAGVGILDAGQKVLLFDLRAVSADIDFTGWDTNNWAFTTAGDNTGAHKVKFHGNWVRGVTTSYYLFQWGDWQGNGAPFTAFSKWEVYENYIDTSSMPGIKTYNINNVDLLEHHNYNVGSVNNHHVYTGGDANTIHEYHHNRYGPVGLMDGNGVYNDPTKYWNGAYDWTDVSYGDTHGVPIGERTTGKGGGGHTESDHFLRGVQAVRSHHNLYNVGRSWASGAALSGFWNNTGFSGTVNGYYRNNVVKNWAPLADADFTELYVPRKPPKLMTEFYGQVGGVNFNLDFGGNVLENTRRYNYGDYMTPEYMLGFYKNVGAPSTLTVSAPNYEALTGDVIALSPI